jgi:hypothetical protein
MVAASAAYATHTQTKLRVAMGIGAAVAVYQIVGDSGSLHKKKLWPSTGDSAAARGSANVTALAWSADGRLLFIGRDIGSIEQLDLSEEGAAVLTPWWPRPEVGESLNGPITALSCVGAHLAATFSIACESCRNEQCESTCKARYVVGW